MRFSRFLLPCSILCILALGLTSCAYLIPENPSAPRYNQVMGERHRPQLNGATAPQSSVAAPVMPVAQNDTPTFPPVEASTQARAQQEMAQTAPEAGIEVATLAPATIPEQGRRVPVENATLDPQISSNYPPLNSVPPRPVMAGEDSTESRLNKVRAQLEADRVNADQTKEQLNRDASAEPSLLNSTVTPPAPVNVTPIAPPPVFAPPPTPQSLNMPEPAQAPQQLSYNYAPEPIMLHPPVANAAYPSPAPVFTPTAPVQSSPPPAMAPGSGGFDPMAGAAPVSGYKPLASITGGAYLPASRYSNRR